MAKKPADWNQYQIFLAVVRAGSFSAAARKFGSTQPTVGRQIEALEKSLGAKLFTRSQRGLQLTSEARELVPLAEQMNAAAAALGRTLTAAASQETGVVRITSGAQLGIALLPRAIAEFSSKFPKIEIELSITSHTEDLLNRDADIAVRLSRPTQQALVARRVGHVDIGLFAHTRYVKAHGIPSTLAALMGHRLIGFDREMGILKGFGTLAKDLRREQFAFRTDNVTAQAALLKAGAGIAACHTCIARQDPELIPVLADEVHFTREVWLAMHSDLRGVHRVRLLFDHLQRSIERGLSDRAEAVAAVGL